MSNKWDEFQSQVLVAIITCLNSIVKMLKLKKEFPKIKICLQWWLWNKSMFDSRFGCNVCQENDWNSRFGCKSRMKNVFCNSKCEFEDSKMNVRPCQFFQCNLE